MRKRRVWLPLGGSGLANGHWLVVVWSFIVTKRRLLSGKTNIFFLKSEIK